MANFGARDIWRAAGLVVGDLDLLGSTAGLAKGNIGHLVVGFVVSHSVDS